MEIEAKEIGLEERLEYLNQISGNQQTNKKSFPWFIAIACVCIGVSVTWLIIVSQKRKETQKDNSHS